jgi:uncharacterized membrane protein YkoI
MKTISHLVIAMGLALALLAEPVSALARPLGQWAMAGPDSLGSGWRQQQGEAREAVQTGRAIPLAKIIDMLRRRVPGRPLDAGLEDWNGRMVYRVRWATDDGRRIDFLVDAENGSILQANGG